MITKRCVLPSGEQHPGSYAFIWKMQETVFYSKIILNFIILILIQGYLFVWETFEGEQVADNSL